MCEKSTLFKPDTNSQVNKNMQFFAKTFNKIRYEGFVRRNNWNCLGK